MALAESDNRQRAVLPQLPRYMAKNVQCIVTYGALASYKDVRILDL